MTYDKRVTPFAAWIVIVAVGCGPDLPETVPVTGKVMSKGEPVTNAQIGFVPQSESPDARPALGTTGEDGSFTLRTYVAPGAEANGAMIGDYKVTVQKTDVPVDPNKLAEMFRKSPNYVPPALLPAQYASPTTTPLEVSVTEDGENVFTLEVDEQKKGKNL